MTFLEFQERKTSTKTKLSSSPKITEAENILIRMPPKIGPIKSPEILSRAAAFLPQLAASNRAILKRRPEDVNIEVLNGGENEIIEMKLGLGVFEEKEIESESENESETDDKKIFILPSEIRAAAAEAAASSSSKMDPFEKVINSLLLFATDTEEDEMEIEETKIKENILEFE